MPKASADDRPRSPGDSREPRDSPTGGYDRPAARATAPGGVRTAAGQEGSDQVPGEEGNLLNYAQRTEVGPDKSRTEIEHNLVRYGASEFVYAWTATEARIAFAIANRRIMFRLPLPDREDRRFTHTPISRQSRTTEAAGREYGQAVHQRWRALLLILKAKLDAVEAGIDTLESEFLAHILQPDGSTVGETVPPRIALAYERSGVGAVARCCQIGTVLTRKLLPVVDSAPYRRK